MDERHWLMGERNGLIDLSISNDTDPHADKYAELCVKRGGTVFRVPDMVMQSQVHVLAGKQWLLGNGYEQWRPNAS